MNQQQTGESPRIKQEDCYKRDNCRLCGSQKLEVVFSLPDIPLADHYLPASRKAETDKCYSMDLTLCEDCGFVFLGHVVDPEIIYRHYLYETTTSPGLLEHFQEYASDVLQRIKPAPQTLVVELGSNDGTLLRHFQKAGLRVLGVDPATDIARRATATGIETWPEFFSPQIAGNIKKQKGGASIVIANNVMANIDDLDSLMQGVREVLAPDGVFIFESAYLPDTVRNLVFDFIYHEHMSYFSVKPLALFFKKHGMELVCADQVATKGGSLRGTVQLSGRRREVESSVADLIRSEIEEGFDRPVRYQQLACALQAEKEKLQRILKDCKAKGKTIAGYGASPTVTTFIYYFDVAGYLDYIVDDNKLKHNTITPGTHIPVVDSRMLYERKPDDVLVLAWRFADLIIQKHPQFRAQGGHFIVPLPSVEVI